MYRNLSLFAVLLAGSVEAAGAQSALVSPNSFSASRAPAPVGEVQLLSPSARADLESRGSFAGPRSLVFGMVGGLIGAGTGFLVSQVVHSDWDKSSDSEFASHRRSFAISGAAVGTVAAFLVARAPTGGATVFAPTRGETREGSGGAIELHEIEKSSATNAYEAVAGLRPQWLVVRGAVLGTFGTSNVGGEGGQNPGSVTTDVPARGRIGAFLDGMPLENLEALRGIPIINVQRIEFRTASVGAAGPGHIQRAIVVITATGAAN